MGRGSCCAAMPTSRGSSGKLRELKSGSWGRKLVVRRKFRENEGKWGTLNLWFPTIRPDKFTFICHSLEDNLPVFEVTESKILTPILQLLVRWTFRLAVFLEHNFLSHVTSQKPRAYYVRGEVNIECKITGVVSSRVGRPSTFQGVALFPL
jgi:hypothetical protein